MDLSTYVRVGRFDLPEPTRTAPPPNSLLAQEASAVTYDWDTDTLFVVGDGGTSVVQVIEDRPADRLDDAGARRQPAGHGVLRHRGLTYVGGGKFVMTEERDRQVVLFTYVAGRARCTGADAQTVKLGTIVGNIGLEGVSYDPLTGGFIVVKETQPEGHLPDRHRLRRRHRDQRFADDRRIRSTCSTRRWPTSLDFSDVFALSNLPSLSGQPTPATC